MIIIKKGDNRKRNKRTSVEERELQRKLQHETQQKRERSKRPSSGIFQISDFQPNVILKLTVLWLISHATNGILSWFPTVSKFDNYFGSTFMCFDLDSLSTQSSFRFRFRFWFSWVLVSKLQFYFVLVYIGSKLFRLYSTQILV